MILDKGLNLLIPLILKVFLWGLNKDKAIRTMPAITYVDKYIKYLNFTN